MLVRLALGEMLAETISVSMSRVREKVDDRRVINKFNNTVQDFNEEFNGTPLDTRTFSEFIKNNSKVHNYCKSYFMYAENLSNDKELLDEIVNLAIEEINKKRVLDGISLFDTPEVIYDYFKELKLNLRYQRIEQLRAIDLLLVALNREGIYEDIKNESSSLREFISNEIKSLNIESASERELTRIGVRTYVGGTENYKNEFEEYLDLSQYFPQEKEYKDNEPFWDITIKNNIESFVNDIKTGVEYEVSLDTVQSVAFTLGYFANAKTNKILYPVQTGVPWIYSPNTKVGEEELTWELTESDDESNEILILIDLMNRNIADDIKDFYEEEPYDLLTIKPVTPDERYVISGDHCIKLVYEANNILQTLPVSFKRKKWKFAFTAPNSFIFLLGRHADQYGKIQLLHFDKANFRYINSINLG